MAQRRAITESFDLYPDDINAGGIGLCATWTNLTGNNPTMVAGRFTGSRGVQMFFAAQLARSLPSTLSACFGFALNRVINGLHIDTIAQIRSTLGGVQCAVGIDGTGRLQIIVGTTVVATSTDSMIINGVWHYIELEHVLHDSTGTINVYLDGVAVPNLSYMGNTRGSSDIDIGQFALIGPNDNHLMIDDLYVEVDGATRVGEGRMDVYLPNSDVSNTGFTPSTGGSIFGVLDDKPADMTDYAQATTTGSIFRCGFASMGYTPEHIFGILLESTSEKAEAGTRILHNKLWGVTGNESGNDHAQTLNTYKWNRDWFPLGVDSGATWTLSELVTANAGIEVVT